MFAVFQPRFCYMASFQRAQLLITAFKEYVNVGSQALFYYFSTTAMDRFPFTLAELAFDILSRLNNFVS